MLERVIKLLAKQNIHLFDPLSHAVLEGGFKDGDHITATLKSGKVVLEKR